MSFWIESTIEPDKNADDLDYRFTEGYCAMFNVHAWPLLLRLAQSYGWKPAGTQPGTNPNQDPADWKGGYNSNSGQVVTAADAAALADALERALPDIPDQEIEGKTVNLIGRTTGNPTLDGLAGLAQLFENDGATVLHGPNPDMHSFEYFSGANKQKILYFVKLCRRGAFVIG